MTSHFTSTMATAGLLALIALPANAAPTLRTEVAVTEAIVTLGDMFFDVDDNADSPMFRAPAPGTTGAVSLGAVRAAAARVGLLEFNNPGVAKISVARQGIRIEAPLLKALIIDDLSRRGIVTGDIIAKTSFNTPFSSIHAEMSKQPVKLIDLHYVDGSGSFAAHFLVAGISQPLELRGRVELMIETPHLVSSLSSGTILTPNHIQMKPVQLRFAQSNGLGLPEAFIGKELRRPIRAGVMLREIDVTEPNIIERSEMVTLYYHHGALTLSVKGQALNAATQGGTISVLNLVSKKVIHGIATNHGTVEMSGPEALSNSIKG